MDKKYQVFISSTYEDLISERRAVEETIIRAGHFPVGMEAFPAADDDQFEFIKAIIRECDYYVVIIAGRYGSIAADGLSYTEKEFDFALANEIPILGFIVSDAAAISLGKSEKKDSGRRKLENFISKVRTGRLVKPWKSVDGLRAVVREALDNAIATKPRVGWVRGNLAADIETLRDLNKVRSENEVLRKKIGEEEIVLPLPELPTAEELVEVTIQTAGYSADYYDAKLAWSDAFPVFQQGLIWSRSDDPATGTEYWHIDKSDSCSQLGDLFSQMASETVGGGFHLNETSFQILHDYFIESGLMADDNGTESPFTEKARKLARRMRINSGARSLRLSFNKRESSRKLDDEIPF
ncbi:DUF4062 domain-containing protein [Sulfitobacter sp. SK011]|uniref:DUF4062 domain-containing protein n=1 Tax=Sulfitobacter sp. SK011 TaxID=1389004 RepID=UPI0013B3914F|nr:DUF4062 domain-containing protein [Sulfitobacter sp. SK011]